MAPFGRGGVHGTLAKIARVVHTPIRSSVELDHIEVHGAGPDARAGIASPTGLARDRSGCPPLAVQRHGQDARGRGLAHTARPREQVAVRPAPCGHRPGPGRADVFLDDEVGEAFGTICSSESDHRKTSTSMSNVECPMLNAHWTLIIEH